MFSNSKKLLKKLLGLEKNNSYNEERIYRSTDLSTRNTGQVEHNSLQFDERNIDDTTDANTEPELILYKFDACPYCKRVQRKIDELQISEKIEMRDTRLDSHWRKNLREQTGRTQVPCLFINGEPLFESLDIIDYLQIQFTSTL